MVELPKVEDGANFLDISGFLIVYGWVFFFFFAESLPFFKINSFYYPFFPCLKRKE